MSVEPKLLGTRKRRWIVVTVLTLVLIVAGMIAITYQPRDVVLVRTETIQAAPLAHFLTRNYNPLAARSDFVLDIPTLAALAANVYEPTGSLDSSCSPNAAGRIPLTGWEQIKGWSYPEACNAALNGLYYEVWQRVDSENTRYVAVVFRGTVPQIMAHWCSNLRTAPPPVCEPSSDQYLSIAPLIDELLSGDYDQSGGDRYVVAVGHSLGGGLAELAGRSSFIKQVFVFDSSPVTGSELSEIFHSEGDEAKANKVMNAFLQNAGCQFRNIGGRGRGNLSVYRIYEHGEGLAFLRLVKRWFVNRSGQPPAGVKQVIEYRTNVLEGNPVSQHNMKALACALRNASSNNALQGTAASSRP